MSISTFFDAYKDATIPHPMHPLRRVWELAGVFELSIGTGPVAHVQLDFIQALFKGQRQGSAALDWLVALAREHDVDVRGHVQRCGTEGLKQGALRAWYARHGFKVGRHGDIRLAVANSPRK